MPASLQALLLAIFPALVVLAAFKDITSFTIPNRLCVTIALLFFPAAFAVGCPAPLMGLHLAVGVAALVLGMGLFAFGWIGGGDAKLLGAASLWIGWTGLNQFLLATALAGGALALILLTLRTRLARAHTPVMAGWFERLATPGGPAPYGVAIACGALAVFPGGDLAALGHFAALFGR